MYSYFVTVADLFDGGIVKCPCIGIETLSDRITMDNAGVGIAALRALGLDATGPGEVIFDLDSSLEFDNVLARNDTVCFRKWQGEDHKHGAQSCQHFLERGHFIKGRRHSEKAVAYKEIMWMDWVRMNQNIPRIPPDRLD